MDFWEKDVGICEMIPQFGTFHVHAASPPLHPLIPRPSPHISNCYFSCHTSVSCLGYLSTVLPPPALFRSAFRTGHALPNTLRQIHSGSPDSEGVSLGKVFSVPVNAPSQRSPLLRSPRPIQASIPNGIVPITAGYVHKPQADITMSYYLESATMSACISFDNDYSDMPPLEDISSDEDSDAVVISENIDNGTPEEGAKHAKGFKHHVTSRHLVRPVGERHTIIPTPTNEYIALIKEYPSLFDNVYNMDEAGVMLNRKNHSEQLIDHNEQVVDHDTRGNCLMDWPSITHHQGEDSVAEQGKDDQPAQGELHRLLNWLREKLVDTFTVIFAKPACAGVPFHLGLHGPGQARFFLLQLKDCENEALRQKLRKQQKREEKEMEQKRQVIAAHSKSGTQRECTTLKGREEGLRRRRDVCHLDDQWDCGADEVLQLGALDSRGVSGLLGITTTRSETGVGDGEEEEVCEDVFARQEDSVASPCGTYLVQYMNEAQVAGKHTTVRNVLAPIYKPGATGTPRFAQKEFPDVIRIRGLRRSQHMPSC
ncbi:uncharacterized protein B0H18DRAFT_950976 [Fomitopsis serialis]|uniref:uncharacterized protein n=1 Tax=Fomitopsis serialis TaxID=139415 RepID=UPI002007DF7A|nr:uncharacterized protein B0H18DRAFT_950976 [Neoantrodia serialis]KAH9935422.1 hypothetical protein B0H18DRAFT_950976 [Neoantrodia serialis]